MRSTWLLSPSAALLLFSATGAAAPDLGAGPPASTPDHLAASAAIVDQLQAGSTLVRRGLQSARAQRDVIKIICLNDKLNQLDVAWRGARERREALAAAAAREDTARVAVERVRLEALREGGIRLVAEANQCLGSPELVTTLESTTSLTLPALPGTPDYPPGDESFVAPLSAASVPEVPPPVSAYK